MGYPQIDQILSGSWVLLPEVFYRYLGKKFPGHWKNIVVCTSIVGRQAVKLKKIAAVLTKMDIYCKFRFRFLSLFTQCGGEG